MVIKVHGWTVDSFCAWSTILRKSYVFAGPDVNKCLEAIKSPYSIDTRRNHVPSKHALEETMKLSLVYQ